MGERTNGGDTVMNRLGLAILLGVAGCAGEPAQQPEASTVTESLQIKVGDALISGAFTHGDDVVKFSAVETEGSVFDTTVELHGLTLSSLVDLGKGTISLDGFVTANGANTTLGDDDRELIGSFRRALDAQVPVRSGPMNVVEVLRGQVGHWEEWPSTLSLTAITVIDKDRSVTKLCGQIGSYVLASHDCNVCSGYNGQTNCQVWAYIGDTGTSSTYYYHNGTWTTQAYNHAVQPSEYGDCYGRCGADCGSGHVYSQDCTNHDSCVRNGHSLGSAYCDDELASCADDAVASGCY